MARTLPLTLLAGALLAFVATAAVAAPQSADRDAQPRRASLDANRDGVIDRAEAALRPALAARFDQLDRDHDGRLDRAERPRRGNARGQRGRGGIARLDVDHDGRLSRQEIAGKARLEQHFAAIDANRDGYVGRAELRGWHARMRPQREAERARRFGEKFAAADLDRDGRLSRVEVGEGMPRLQQRFAWLDEDRDGFLDRDELRSGGRR